MNHRVTALSLALIAPLSALWAQNPPPPPAQQPAAPACSVELMQPSQLGIASLQRQKVVNAKTPDEANRAIKDAMRLLFDDKVKSNPMGRDMLMGEFFTLAIPYGDVQTRGQLGMPGDKNAAVDLVVATDSLFQLVEKADAKCKNDTEQWRMFKPYQEKVQAAYKAINANQADSAEKLAKRALVLYKDGAQPYDVLWRVAKARNDEAGQITNLQLAADRLVGDTLNMNVRANFLFNLGRIQQEFAALKTDAAQKNTLYKNAAVAYLQVVKEFPTAEETPFAIQGVSISSAVTNDSAMGREVVSVVKGAMSKYSDVSLAQTGVLATRDGKSADAAALFEAATKANPYMRDHQYNLAAMLFEAKRSSEMMPVVRRLLELDPSNPDNVRLFAYAFKGLSDNAIAPALKDSAERFAKADANGKKALRDSLTAARNRQKPFIDSVAYYGTVADQMPHSVVYTEFDRLKDRTTLKGQVENRGKVARSFTIEFEFLGKDGAVFTKQTATTPIVAPNASGDFLVDVPLGGCWGVRYAALPAK